MTKKMGYPAGSLFWLLLSITILISACQPRNKQAEAPRVKIESGVLEGAYVADDFEIAVFKGIPYAAPPVSNLRWKPPQPVKSWEGIRSATEYGPACPQPDRSKAYMDNLSRKLGVEPSDSQVTLRTSEDCLHLNVWTPDPESEEAKPVMVWIHGGGNLTGSGTTPGNDGTALAQKGVVVVTINYRLGALGYLAHPALTAESAQYSSGNYGLLDQIEALRWVRNNISAFGGDPQRVTIFGCSAGGTNVGLLMASPIANGLFHRAISQSGATIFTTQPLEAAEAGGLRLSEDLGVTGEADVLSALRSQNADKIVKTALKQTGVADPFTPNIDGWLLTDLPGKIFAQGRQSDVPLLVGSTADEGTLLVPGYFPDPNEEIYRATMGILGTDFAEEMFNLYPLSKFADVTSALNHWMADFVFGGNAKYMALAWEKLSSPVYLYNFTRVPPSPGDAELGAYHGSEVSFVFNTHIADWPKQAYDDALTDIISSYWVQFAATGDPNGNNLPPWPIYDQGTDQHLEIGEEVKAAKGLRQGATSLMAKIVESTLK